MIHRTGSSPSVPLHQLVQAALQSMKGLGYSPGYLRLCRGVWQDFLHFAYHSPTPEAFSQELVTRFLTSRGILPESAALKFTSRQRLIRAVMRILSEFYFHGCYQRRRCAVPKVILAAPLQALLSDYQGFSRQHLRCTPGTMRCRTRHLTRFLYFLESHQVHDLATLQAGHLSAFVRSQIHLRPKTIAVIVSDLRSFLRFLCLRGILAEDLSAHVPKVRMARNGHVPTVWNREQIPALLAAVDRGSPKGKRDYAILLLACRLGLRVSDIRCLRLEHLNWKESRIEMTQAKTGALVVLPLTEEVGEALIDYLRHGRPVTSHQEVFLRINAPVEPFGSNDNLHHIITFYRQRAGIALPPQGGTGLHSLRHTVATWLLEAGTSLETIASILGHRSLESTQIYTKIDVETLRQAALDPEVSHD
jgi:site-specific recombinase XerD